MLPTALPVINNRNERIKVGGCVSTGPNKYGNINTEHVLHAVGPDFRSHPAQQAETLLLSAYASSLSLAQEKGIKRVAFPFAVGWAFSGDMLHWIESWSSRVGRWRRTTTTETCTCAASCRRSKRL